MGIEEKTQATAHLCREIQDKLATAEGVWLPVGVGGSLEQISSKGTLVLAAPYGGILIPHPGIGVCPLW